MFFNAVTPQGFYRVASEDAAEFYGLSVIARNIADKLCGKLASAAKLLGSNSDIAQFFTGE